MDKTKISKKQETISEKLANVNLDKVPGLKRYHPLKNLADENKIGKSILECLKNNDPEGVMEIISIYIEALNKTNLRKKGNIPKSTFFHSIKNKNPTIKTLAKLFYSCSHY